MLALTIALTGMGILGMLFACYSQLRYIGFELRLLKGQSERHHHEKMEVLTTAYQSLRVCEEELVHIKFHTRGGA